jgi:hypothetical protein
MAHKKLVRIARKNSTYKLLYNFASIHSHLIFHKDRNCPLLHVIKMFNKHYLNLSNLQSLSNAFKS